MLRSLTGVAHTLYARRLRGRLAGATLPRHVAMVADERSGHRHTAGRLAGILGWCAALEIPYLTVFLASADAVPAGLVGDLARPGSGWQVHLAGRLDALPGPTRRALELAAERTRDASAAFCLTLAIGYDGREEIVDAIRSLLEQEARAGRGIGEVAGRVTGERIAAHLSTSGRPDPDLIIRTSGERRMSGALLWQAAYSELYFCDASWPGFRQVDFLRALRSYAARHRRFGG